jgi:hypothetical protein
MRALLLGALATLAACTPSFQDQSEVIDLRVLAVSAEPPEAFADIDAGTVDDVSVTVLVADPVPRATVDASASICFPTDNLICQTPRIDLSPQTAPKPGELSFQVAAPAPVIAGALQNDKLKGFGGVRVQFTAQVGDGDPHGPVTGEKVLLFSTTPRDQANHTPRIVSLEVTRSSGTVQELDAGQTLQMAAGEQVGIRPIVGPGPEGAEDYTTTDLTGAKVSLHEQLSYSFYALLGASWDKDTASETLPGQPLPTFGINRLQTYRQGSGTFWIIVYDGRGGVSWFTGQWKAT